MEFSEVESVVTKHMERLENELGSDMVPILIIIMCRSCVKYNLDIEWVTATIKMGYNNELPPDFTEDVEKFDS